MPDEPLRISDNDARAETEDRFHRFKLIGWWDQALLRRSKILVIGAGALGNEIIKNLALLGIGNIFVADLDRIENSNLSRSVLYRAGDNGKYKASVAAEAATHIYPDLVAQAFNGNMVYDLGLGVYRWADLVIAGLDNREARLAINRACYRVNKPWIDGAIEQIQGTARVFQPDGPCYECTMTQTDWRLLQMRRSCNLLTKTEMVQGKTPTTPTISSIIAGVQCQEAIKILHGMESMAGSGWVFAGLSADSYPVVFQRKPDCLSHDPLDAIESLDASSDNITLAELLAHARRVAGADAHIELGRDVLRALTCPKCGQSEAIFRSLGKVDAGIANCPACGDVRRDVELFHRIHGNEDFLDRTASQIGIPPYDIVIARGSNRSVGLELAGDAAAVLGPLHSGEGELEWA